MKKRLLDIFLSLALALAFTACGDTDSSAQTNSAPENSASAPAGNDPDNSPADAPDGGGSDLTSTPDETLLEEPHPEHYAYAYRIDINPSFLLYVADNGTVLQATPLNDDARVLMRDEDFTNKPVENTVTDIVTASIDRGYLKSGGKVEVKLIKSYSSDRREFFLDSIRECADSAAKNRGADIQIDLTRSENALIDEDKNVPEDGSQGDPDHPDDPAESRDENSQGNDPGPGGNDKPEGCSVCWGSGVCDRCDGKGTITCEVCHGSGGEKCSQCSGEGKMRCSCGDGKCWHCHGAGTLPCENCDGTDANCPACHGTGRMDCNSCDHGECTQCGGTLYTGTCNQCNGKGTTPCGPCKGTGKTECQGCQGSGKCAACGGTGLNPHIKV